MPASTVTDSLALRGFEAAPQSPHDAMRHPKRRIAVAMLGVRSPKRAVGGMAGARGGLRNLRRSTRVVIVDGPTCALRGLAPMTADGGAEETRGAGISARDARAREAGE